MNNDKSENVPVSLPGWIVQLVDERVNKSLSLSRSSFIKSAILKALLPEKEDDAEFWEKYIREEEEYYRRIEEEYPEEEIIFELEE